MTENLHYVDLWKKQSELFWRTVYSIPLIGMAIFAGWYALESKEQFALSQYLLIAGILIMLVQMVILYRMAQYLNAFRGAADTLIPSVPSALLGLTGYRIGVAIPVILIVLFLFMLRVDIEPTSQVEEQQQPVTTNKPITRK